MAWPTGPNCLDMPTGTLRSPRAVSAPLTPQTAAVCNLKDIRGAGGPGSPSGPRLRWHRAHGLCNGTALLGRVDGCPMHPGRGRVSRCSPPTHVVLHATPTTLLALTVARPSALALRCDRARGTANRTKPLGHANRHLTQPPSSFYAPAPSDGCGLQPQRPSWRRSPGESVRAQQVALAPRPRLV